MSLHVLITEDEPAIADTLLYAFKEAGILTTHVLLGHDAIIAMQGTAFDFVILDVGLPDMSGFDVCKQIRANSHASISSIPLLFLTARNHEIDRIVGLEIGADDYVTKPFSPREVVARVHAILRRNVRNEPTAKSPAIYELDESACRITYHGEYLSLTRYEYLLLKTFIQQPKHVFSRSQLMDIVWAQAENTLERTVDAHIKTLRAKLKAVVSSDKQDAIITHRGMGYSLTA